MSSLDMIYFFDKALNEKDKLYAAEHPEAAENLSLKTLFLGSNRSTTLDLPDFRRIIAMIALYLNVSNKVHAALWGRLIFGQISAILSHKRF